MLCILIAIGICSSTQNSAEGYDSPNIIGHSEPTIVVVEEHQPNETDDYQISDVLQCYNDQVRPVSMTASSPYIRDVRDNAIGSYIVKREVPVDHQILLEGAIIDTCIEPNHPVLVLLEVRDSQGITAFFAWQNMTMSQDEQANIGVSWRPEKIDDYTIRMFTFHCLNCLGILHPVMSYDLSVVPK